MISNYLSTLSHSNRSDFEKKSVTLGSVFPFLWEVATDQVGLWNYFSS